MIIIMIMIIIIPITIAIMIMMIIIIILIIVVVMIIINPFQPGIFTLDPTLEDSKPKSKYPDENKNRYKFEKFILN